MRRATKLKTAYCAWLAPKLIDSRPELRGFSSARHHDLIERFRRLDAELTELATEAIRAKLAPLVPRKDDRGAHPGYSVLAREVQKRTGHKPVRQLVAEMGDALLALTPCLMMSPLSVAKFLGASAPLFDLVVFDEASQIPVWDAVGAIARGRFAVIVGDPKQMPPTSFFDRNTEEEDEEADLESILDEALSASVRHWRLTGHYRSRHESLIAFSNHAYYENQLVTYPSADTRSSVVSLRRVDGVYGKGRTRTNPIEAQAVVGEVLRRLQDPKLSKLSLGIVTLNAEQQRLIENLLDEARRRHPEIDRFFSDASEEPVFVKNLETVQGDQRDVILLGIGYGPTEPGSRSMSMNFGPLNRGGGERRWNVAITRATTELIVFASFDASMVDLSRTQARAVRDLKHYLDFAERGPMALAEAIHSAFDDRYDSDFEAEVADALRARGWVVKTQVGVSRYRIDLGVVHPDAPGRFLAGVECDGAMYHSLPSARDRDRVRHAVLERLGWRLLRIWSTDFFVDPDRVMNDVHAQLERRLFADRERPKSDEPNADTFNRREPSLESNTAPPLALEPEPSFEPEPQLEDSSAPDPSRFYEPIYRPTLAALASVFIDENGPVLERVVIEGLARQHGFQRVGKRIREAARLALVDVRPRSEDPNGESVLWPDGTEPRDILPFRPLGRTFGDVPAAELRGLAEAVLETETEDPAALFARRAQMGRLTSGLRRQIEALLAEARGR